MNKHLLPANASPLERLAAQAFAQIERTPVPLRQLWNPDTCPVELLPILAWTFSVDRWSESWPEQMKRDAIKGAYFIHAHKGTLGALRRVVEPLGYLLEVVEWWQESPPGVPGTFRLLIGLDGQAITEEIYNELELLVDDAKPVSRHLSSMGVSASVYGAAYIGAFTMDSNVLHIYPPPQRNINVSHPLTWAVREHVIDTLDI